MSGTYINKNRHMIKGTYESIASETGAGQRQGQSSKACSKSKGSRASARNRYERNYTMKRGREEGKNQKGAHKKSAYERTNNMITIKQ